MKSLAVSYTEELLKEQKYLANWLPNNPIKLGFEIIEEADFDIGNGYFLRGLCDAMNLINYQKELVFFLLLFF